MNAPPDERVIGEFLSRVRRRLAVVHTVEGAVVGCVPALGAALAGGGTVAIVSVVVVAAIVRAALGDHWQWGWWRSRSGLAQRVERRTPSGRNLIVTAAEAPVGVSRYVAGIVNARAARLAAALDLATLFPLRHALSVLVVGVSILAVVIVRPAVLDRVRPIVDVPQGTPSVRRVEVTVVPPAYSGLPTTTSTNPPTIEALTGSRIELRIEANARTIRIETLTGVRDASSGDTAFQATIVAESDGFIAIEPRDSAGVPGPRALMGLSVTPDRAPRVSLASPGRDLFFSAVPGTLPVTINAEDDLALASLRLRYTAVSGSGERFTFIERDVPVSVSAATAREWTARGTWRLDSLELAPGDLVVYRAVATDRRPGAPPVESESYVIEMVTPGAIAAEGFAADDQRDRYAVSQQMVILKTERLLARRTRLPSDSVASESRLLAAEQRQVRAEFVFMMGGELEDMAAETAGTLELNEVAEAEAEDDLLAGRQQNQGRVDMMRAIRAMSRASTALTSANLDQALIAERAALDNLMRAFARSRFILRALTLRERIDLERRLSGSLAITAGLRGPAAEAEPAARVVALRRLMSELAAMSSGDSNVGGTRVTEAALTLLRADPASDTIRGLATRVQLLARERRGLTTVTARARIDSLLNDLSSLAASALPLTSGSRASVELGVLEGSLRDALRRGAPR